VSSTDFEARPRVLLSIAFLRSDSTTPCYYYTQTCDDVDVFPTSSATSAPMSFFFPHLPQTWYIYRLYTDSEKCLSMLT